MENKKTINTLNQYINDLKEVNRDLITVNENENTRIPQTNNKRNEHEILTVKALTQSGDMCKIYVGNIVSTTTKEEIIKLFGLNATEYLKNNSEVKVRKKERKRTRVQCTNINTAEGCGSKHKCRFIHPNEFDGTVTYAEIYVPSHCTDEF